MFVAYLRTFARLGLTAIPMVAETGPIGGDLSHEFIILASTGESEVFCHKDYLGFAPPPEPTSTSTTPAPSRRWSTNGPRSTPRPPKNTTPPRSARCDAGAQVSARGIEVGHIFYFGTKYSAPMKAVVNGPDGKEHAVHMGSYGIGPSRLAAALIEAGHDEAGIIWPEAAAPFDVGLANLKVGDGATDAACARIYNALGARRAWTCSMTIATSGPARNSRRWT